jgi:glycosyltransferase involved in cell wall biosynthesis
MSPPILSIITLTKDPSRTLAKLALDLSQQTSSDFNWIIVDSQDINNISQHLVHFPLLAKKTFLYSQPPDQPGLYAALNLAVSKCDSPFYLVIGSDDRLFPFAVYNILESLRNSPESAFLSYDVFSKSRLVCPLICKPYLLAGPRKYFSSHSVGTVILKTLHQSYGDYPSNYSIAGDEYFLHRALFDLPMITRIALPLGVFGDSGVSSVKTGLMLLESWQAKRSLGLLHTLLFFVRYLKYLLIR